MPLARIRTLDPGSVSNLVSELRAAGYECEIAGPDEHCARDADYEIDASILPVQEAFDRAYEFSITGMPVYVAPGLLETAPHNKPEKAQAASVDVPLHNPSQDNGKPSYELADPIPYAQSLDLDFQQRSTRFDSERTERRSLLSGSLESVREGISGTVARFRQRQLDRAARRSLEAAKRAEIEEAQRQKQQEQLAIQREAERRRREEMQAAMERERLEREQREREAAAQRERDAVLLKQREAEERAQREHEAAELRARQEREAAMQREREAVELRQREAAAARERQLQLERERELALSRQRDEELRQKQQAEAATARQRELTLAREREEAKAHERELQAQRRAESEQPPQVQPVAVSEAQQELIPLPVREHVEQEPAVVPPPIMFPAETMRSAPVTQEAAREFHHSLQEAPEDEPELVESGGFGLRQRAFRQAAVAAAVITVVVMGGWAAVANRRPADPLNLRSKGAQNIQQQVPFGTATVVPPPAAAAPQVVHAAPPKHTVTDKPKPVVAAKKPSTKRSTRRATTTASRKTKNHTTARARTHNGVKQYSDLD